MGFKKFFRSYFFQQFIKLTAFGVSAGLSFLLIAMWCLAFLNGGSIIVNINSYGEMYFELGLNFVLILVIWYGYILALREFQSNKRRLRKSVIWFMSLDKMETL